MEEEAVRQRAEEAAAAEQQEFEEAKATIVYGKPTDYKAQHMKDQVDDAFREMLDAQG